MTSSGGALNNGFVQEGTKMLLSVGLVFSPIVLELYSVL